QDDRRWCVLLDEHGYVFYSNQRDISYEDYLEDPIHKGKHISQWFGGINRVSQRVMSLLVEKRFYIKLKYTDHQALCKEKKVVVMSGSSLRPFHSIYRWLMSSIYQLLLLAKQYPLLHFFHSFVKPVESYTASFHEGSDGFPCSKQSYFYLSNSVRWKIPATEHESGGYESIGSAMHFEFRKMLSVSRNLDILFVWRSFCPCL
ncbi:hypothetical protein OSTOST_23522, partial [Ostertagia ostertagi]